MTSVVIAAHNEAAVLDRCLDGILGPDGPTPDLEVIVVPNGCRDDTAVIARRRGVRVIELPTAGKAAALNAGDAAATSFPRIYLDADIVVDPGGIPILVRALADSGALAAVPARRMELRGRPLPVRAYYTIHSRLPAMRNGLYGRGLIALSEQGRARFGEFPAETADDLFLDSLFSDEEKLLVSEVTTRVSAPMRTADLVRRLARVRAGNDAMRATAPNVRRSDKLSWLTDVVLPAPWLAPAAVCYVSLTLAAERRARRMRRAGTIAWSHDTSSRIVG